MKLSDALLHWEEGAKIVRKKDFGIMPPWTHDNNMHAMLYRDDFLAKDWIVVELIPRKEWTIGMKSPYKIVVE